MLPRPDRRWIRWTRAGLFLLALVLLPAAGLAHGPGHGGHRGVHSHPPLSHHVWRPGGHPLHHGRFVVPKLLHRQHVSFYRPYLYGSVFYRPHRHYHTIYRFPVYGPAGVVTYRPHAYCEGKLLAVGHFTPRGPSFSLSLRF